MDNILKKTYHNPLIPSDSKSEWYFIILACLFWAEDLFEYLFVAADKILGTGLFIRTTGEAIIFVVFALGSFGYLSRKVRLRDFVFVGLFLLLFFFSPAIPFVPKSMYEDFTHKFLWALPFYLLGATLDFSKVKNLFRILSIATIWVSSLYFLYFIHGANYSGDAEFGDENMYASYQFVLPIMYLIWYTFFDFKLKEIGSLINLFSIILGIFAISMLGTRGPLVAIGIYVILYVFFFKISKHKVLYGLLFLCIAYVLIIWSEEIFMFFGSLAVNLGFSDRIFVSFLSGANIFKEGSTGRDAFYPILFRAMNDSPVFGYGIFGSFEFINAYPHNIFLEIIFSFGYVFGGLMIIFVGYLIKVSFNNNMSKDETGFLFVLIGAGIIGLLFSNSFVVTPAFYLFFGFCLQMAYKK